jgi:hypothetical protein
LLQPVVQFPFLNNTPLPQRREVIRGAFYLSFDVLEIRRPALACIKLTL